MTNDTNQQMDQLSSKFGEVIDLRKARDPGMTLVRPDGYVAYASHRTGDPDSMRAIETMLHKQAR